MPHDEAAFGSLILSGLDACHNLAWWLTRDEHEAADVVQEACLKAWQSFAGYRGGDGRSWLLRIVRNTVASRRRRRHGGAPVADSVERELAAEAAAPGAFVLREIDRRIVEDAVASLPEALREVLVLREIEGLRYSQIALVLEVPVGTVMSRLSRARDAAREALRAGLGQE